MPELLELVGLQSAGHKACKHFSLGMKQRLRIALALIVAYAGLEAFFEDLNVGFIKTICSSTLGRGGYPLEKVIFLGIITLMGFVLLMPISIVTALVTGSTFSTLDGMGAACTWFACA